MSFIMLLLFKSLKYNFYFYFNVYERISVVIKRTSVM